jgi:hypothetical protein
MNNWTKAFLTGCLIEIPLLALLSLGGSEYGYKRFIFEIVAWYHFIPLSIVSTCFLMLFGHNAPFPGSIMTWHLLYVLSVFAIQVALTTPIAYRLIAGCPRSQ